MWSVCVLRGLLTESMSKHLQEMQVSATSLNVCERERKCVCVCERESFFMGKI